MLCFADIYWICFYSAVRVINPLNEGPQEHMVNKDLVEGQCKSILEWAKFRERKKQQKHLNSDC